MFVPYFLDFECRPDGSYYTNNLINTCILISTIMLVFSVMNDIESCANMKFVQSWSSFFNYWFFYKLYLDGKKCEDLVIRTEIFRCVFGRMYTPLIALIWGSMSYFFILICITSCLCKSGENFVLKPLLNLFFIGYFWVCLAKKLLDYSLFLSISYDGSLYLIIIIDSILNQNFFSTLQIFPDWIGYSCAT